MWTNLPSRYDMPRRTRDLGTLSCLEKLMLHSICEEWKNHPLLFVCREILKTHHFPPSEPQFFSEHHITYKLDGFSLVSTIYFSSLLSSSLIMFLSEHPSLFLFFFSFLILLFPDPLETVPKSLRPRCQTLSTGT